MTRQANKLPALKPPTSVANVVDNVLDVAKSQVGYREGYEYGHWNNDNIFSETLNGWSGYAWCVDFVNWSVTQAGYGPLTYRTSSCSAYYRWAVKNDLIGNDGDNPPKAGDFIDFTGGSTGHKHFGIIAEVHPTYLVTYEGNTNTSGSAEGDGVYRKIRPRIDGAYDTIRPDWASVVVKADPPVKEPIDAPHKVYWQQIRWQIAHKDTIVYGASSLAFKKALRAAGYTGALSLKNQTLGYGTRAGVRWVQKKLGDKPDKGTPFLGAAQLAAFAAMSGARNHIQYGGAGSLVATGKKKG